MEWNVYHDFNHQKIVTYNVFNHGSFNREINELSQNLKNNLKSLPCTIFGQKLSGK